MPTEDRADRRDSLLERLYALRRAGGALAPATLLEKMRAPLERRYRVQRELGRGGMAVVFLAEDIKHGRRVALKILRPELTSDIGNARFLHEIAIVAQLTHPHILPLHDSGEAADLLYYVMPYMEGESLRDRLSREGRIALDEALRLTREVADALSYAHAHDVVHRDIKPENILLQSGHAVVSDFGIARAMSAAGGEDLAEAAIALGTPGYMSPEQIRGDAKMDGRSDVYSLGCVLHEMLRGAPPFSGDSTAVIMDEHLHGKAPEIPGVPVAVARVVRRAMAKEPAERWATAADFAEALGSAAASASPAARRNRRRLAVLAGAVAIAAGVAATALTRTRSPVHPAAAVMAILPLVPAQTDSALARLGRDLVVTLSASLDGISEIRMVDALTLLAQTRESGALGQLNEGFRLAQRLGASSIVHGTLARGDSLAPIGRVRVDLGIYVVDGGARIGSASVIADAHDLAALTDTLAWTLLREVWRTRAPPTPNLAAVTTRSLPALREFLDGERAALESRWDAAAESYARAMRADSTFWLAHWRYAFARWWYLEAVDDAIIAGIKRHRHALPERDRLVFESWVTDTFSVALARSRDVTTRYPDYWPGWMQHADWLFHVGPAYGHARAEAKAALERTVVLNPALIPAWEHLYWATIHDDTAMAAVASDALERLGFGRTSTAEFGFDLGRVYRYELALLGATPAVDRLRDSIVVDLVTAARARHGGGATLAAAQVAISERVLRARPRPELAALHGRILSDAWASRGAWDSALVVADQHVRRPMPAGADRLIAYRLAVIGAWVGAVRADAAVHRRDVAAAAVSRVGTNAMLRAELAWLDGMLAVARRDRAKLVAARERLRRADTVSTALLDRTLGAFEAELAGDRELAAATLAATNWRNPDLLVPGYNEHPYVIAVSRLAAGRWLAAQGANEEALRLLRWFEAEWALDGYRPARRVLFALAALDRARIAEVLGRPEESRRERATVARRYDMAGAPLTVGAPASRSLPR
ncbi:MAG: serine/threonine-protein kinase [Gemmatimonadaceae bacterium]